MPADTITLALEGDVYLDDFATAVAGLQRLVSALATEIAKEAKIEWTVDALERSSAIATIRGYSDTPEIVEQVAEAYLAVGRYEEQGRPIPYGQPVRTALESITGILNGRVKAVRLETADGEATLQRTTDAATVVVTHAYGAVTGRVQSISNRGGLRFTLYDLIHDRAVSCYLSPGQEEIMRGMWGKLAIVEGWVTRERVTARALSVRQIRKIVPKPEVEPGSYRHAIGAVPRPDGAKSPEAIIRRLRDG